MLLAVALAFMPAVIGVLAPGFNADPGRFALATELTRITFPYLLLISLVTLYGGILNALGRFATPAARADPAQPVDDDGAGAGGVLPDRRPRRGVGRADRRCAGGDPGRLATRGGRARCRSCAGRGSTWR